MLPHELASKLVVPELRGIIAYKLRDRGLSQLRIARLLGVSQSMVSRYSSIPPSRLYERLRRIGLDEGEVNRVVDVLVLKLVSGSYQGYLSLLSSYINTVLRRGLLCGIHRRISPSVPKDCDVCTRLFVEMVDPYVEEVRTAFEILSLHPRGHEIVPEVGMNIVSAPPDASDFRDVVGFPGRIIRVYNRVVAVGEPIRGGSRHTANVLLRVMRRFPSSRSVVVIKYSSECVHRLASAGLNIVKTGPHSSEQEFFATIERTVVSLEKEPDAIADSGGLGMEPVVYVFAVSAVDAVKKALICVER